LAAVIADFPQHPMTPWLIYSPTNGPQTNAPPTNSIAKFRLFCFPYSGAGASIFRTWAAPLAPDIEVVAVQPPGRENRRQEPLFNNLLALIEALTPALLPYLDRPFAFFGHSVGALIGFEVARQLRRTGHLSPFHLIVSGRLAPQLPAATPPIHRLPDADFLAELQRYNGTPAIVLENAAVMNVFMPILRADLAMNETYVYQPEAPFDFPITAFGGLEDSQVSQAALSGWAEQTTANCRIELLPGNHFFLKEQKMAILQHIASLCELG
jgi:medium-chain acyl-[acyl-carrier-protein] hydrolase